MCSQPVTLKAPYDPKVHSAMSDTVFQLQRAIARPFAPAWRTLAAMQKKHVWQREQSNCILVNVHDSTACRVQVTVGHHQSEPRLEESTRARCCGLPPRCDLTSAAGPLRLGGLGKSVVFMLLAARPSHEFTALHTRSCEKPSDQRRFRLPFSFLRACAKVIPTPRTATRPGFRTV